MRLWEWSSLTTIVCSHVRIHKCLTHSGERCLVHSKPSLKNKCTQFKSCTNYLKGGFKQTPRVGYATVQVNCIQPSLSCRSAPFSLIGLISHKAPSIRLYSHSLPLHILYQAVQLAYCQHSLWLKTLTLQIKCMLTGNVISIREMSVCSIWDIKQCIQKTCFCCQVRRVLQLEYFSDIPRTSGRTPDVQLRAMDAAFCIIRHLVPNSAECSDVFPFCYDSNISLIYCGRPTLHNGRSVFALSDNSRPIRPSVPMFSFHNISPFLFPDLFS